MSMHDDIKNVLVSEEELKAKVRELGAQISRDYEGKNLVLVSILKGSVVFMADLLAACCQKRQASPLPGRDPRLVHPFAQLLAHAPACRVETVSRLTVAQNKSRIQRSYFSIIRLIF